MRRLREESGFTLVELLAVCAVLTIVMGGLSSVMVSGLRTSDRGQAELATQGDMRSALDRLDYEARCADTATLLSAGAGVYLHMAAQCTHATGDVSWCVSGGSLVRLAAQTCTGTAQTLIGGVTSAAPFCLQTVTGDLPQLYVALTVDAGTNTGDSLSETDAITLRNADPATSTSASCT